MQVIERDNALLQRNPRAIFLPFLVLGLALLAASISGCGGPAPGGGDGTERSSTSGDVPELTDEVIKERINYSYVRNIPEETGASEPISWSFVSNEPREITVVERKMEGNRATLILDIKTSSSPRARSQRSLAGQIRTEWALRTGWVLRQWEIVDTENISMKYKNLPKPPDQNSNGKPALNANGGPQPD